MDAGFGRVLVQAGAGAGSSASDAEYVAAGGEIARTAAATLAPADVVVKVRPPDAGTEVPLLKEASTLVSYLQPSSNASLLDALSARAVTALALDCIPRTLSRAQAFDTLSSQANVAGHRAAIEAAHAFGRLIPSQTTAAGRVPPARALVIGGGVAGLAAAGAARSMGAVVKIFDTRAAVEEQAKSMGCEFVGGPAIMQGEAGEGGGGYAAAASDGLIERERALFEALAPATDIIISTALVPGRRAPVLVTGAALASMRRGSVVVDLAAEAGGNVEGTVAGAAVCTGGGVTILGYTDLPSRLAPQASALFANNVVNFLLSVGPFTSGVKGVWAVDEADAAVRGALVLHGGALTWPPPPLPPPPAPKPPPPPTAAALAALAAATPEGRRSAAVRSAGVTALGVASLVGLGAAAPGPTLATAVLATAAGYQTVQGVAHALHAPLMSVTNAISGTTAVGGLLLSGGGLIPSTTAQGLAAASGEGEEI